MDGAGYQVAELAGGKLEELGQVAWVATLINGLKILKILVTVANLFLFCLWVDNDQNVQWDPTIGPIGTKLLLFVILWVDCWRSQRPVTIPLSAPYFFLPMLRCQRGESLRTGSWFDVRWILTATRCTGLKGSIAPDFHWFSTIQHQPIPPKFCVLSFLRSRCRSRCFFCALGHSSLWEDWEVCILMQVELTLPNLNMYCHSWLTACVLYIITLHPPQALGMKEHTVVIKLSSVRCRTLLMFRSLDLYHYVACSQLLCSKVST